MPELPDLDLKEVIAKFASLTGDAVGIGYREPDDFEARMLWVNDAHLEMFGYTAEELIGQYVSFLLDPATRDDLIAQVTPQFEAGARFVRCNKQFKKAILDRPCILSEPYLNILKDAVRNDL